MEAIRGKCLSWGGGYQRGETENTEEARRTSKAESEEIMDLPQFTSLEVRAQRNERDRRGYWAAKRGGAGAFAMSSAAAYASRITFSIFVKFSFSTVSDGS